MTTRDTLLLADDMVSNRVFVGKLFEDEFNILEAEDGEQAMEVMAANHSTIAAVLLDLIMPGKDGFQVLAEMREQGYLDGYAAGYVDGNGGEMQDFQILSQESNPYAFGSSKWKGYIRGFDIGYSAGYADAQEK